LDVAQLGGYVTASGLYLAFGATDGTFVNGPAYATGLYAGGLAAVDFDGDGVVDLATGSKYFLRLWHNDGAGVLSVGQSVTSGYYVKGLAAGDLDNDGDADMIATYGSSAAIVILENAGNGQFAPTASLPASVQDYAVLLADTNGDGYLDPWAGDVQSGLLIHAASHCIVARYGDAKANSLGCLPTWTATGTPSIGGAGFTPQVIHEIAARPALVLAGSASAAIPALGGHLLVSAPWIFVPGTTSAGSGDPTLCDGTLALPISGSMLAPIGVGTKIFLQVLSSDPGAADGTGASLSDGLRFEVIP
jgi:hypothetical protein